MESLLFKKWKRLIMYVEIISHDNDFSNRFIEALSTLWHTVHEGKFSSDTRTDEEVFKQLIDKNMVLPAIIRLVALSSVKQHVIWAIESHSINYEKTPDTPDWNSTGIGSNTVDFYVERYFNDIKLKVHDNDKFTCEWQNGEHYWLDVTNGIVGQF